jgi:hypothetical protein
MDEQPPKEHHGREYVVAAIDDWPNTNDELQHELP